MGNRAFAAVVAAGFVALGAMGWTQATGADRLRARARASRLATAELYVREMG